MVCVCVFSGGGGGGGRLYYAVRQGHLFLADFIFGFRQNPRPHYRSQ